MLMPRSEKEAWYAVVDENGVLFGGHLPFVVESLQDVHVTLGKRPDGSTIAALRSFRDGKMEVVHGGQTIYEGTDTWDFDLASDGSSFVAIEPLAGGSRLVLRNLDTGSEHHYDLEDSISDRGVPGTWRGFVRYAWYSPAHTEVIVNANRNEGGTYRFYPLDGGRPREVRTDPNIWDRIDIFQSSALSYHGHPTPDGSIKLYREERRFQQSDKSHQTVEVWSREFQPQDTIAPPLVSDDGAWVVLGMEPHGIVLDATNGNTVISVPFDEESRRLHGVATGVHFLGDQIALYRYKRRGESRGQRFVEIYDLDPEIRGLRHRTAIESAPHARIAGFGIQTYATGKSREDGHNVDTQTPCAHPVLSDSRVLVADGDRLTYRVPEESARP